MTPIFNFLKGNSMNHFIGFFSLRHFFIFAATSAVICSSSFAETSAVEAQALGIGALFKAHVSALEALQLSAPSSSPLGWHLGAMTAGFGVSGNGIFGAVSAGGTVSVTATWEKLTEASAVLQNTNATPRSNPRTVVVDASMSETEFDQQLEPAIRVALATGAVKNEEALRANLQAKAQDFLKLAQVLSTISSGAEWDVAGLQLQLAFNASGEVTPLIGVGGGASISLLWQKPSNSKISSDDPSGPNNSSGNLTSNLANNLDQFSKIISEELSIAVAQSDTLKNSNFVLNEMMVGIQVTATEDVAIGQAGGSLTGELKFVRKKKVLHHTESALAANSMIPMISGSIPADQFSKGLKDAIDKSATLAKLGAKQNSKNWGLTSVSATFSASASGALSFASGSVKGQIGLSFKHIQILGAE
jgi:hypothetical protein